MNASPDTIPIARTAGSARRNDPLLTPFRLRHLVLRNRIISTSHASTLTENDFPQERYQRYHEEKAIGGIAMSMFGGSSNIGIDSPNVFSQIDIGTDEVVPHLQRFSRRMHAHGAALMCQITHMGRRADPYAGQWLPAIAPSGVRETLHRAIPREMTDADIRRVVRYFGEAARRCKLGGLDGLETLAGGHLLGQFLNPAINLRTDRFGGSLENRCRFVLMVHEEIRRQVGDDYIVGIRYAVEDGTSFEESVRAAAVLERSGLFDFFNVVYGRMDTGSSLVTDNMPTMSQPSSPWLQKAAAFRRQVRLPVFHAAKISDLATARHAIGDGLLDLVGMTRAHMADPHLVRKLVQGREAEVRPCVGASFCRGHQAACIHNPATGRETWVAHEVDAAPLARRVVVVGGGPAGLEAARVAALRGHDVVLLEAAPRVGGQVLLAALGSWRKDLLGIVDWRVDELARLGVEVRTGTYADAADVAALSPDVVIVATGGIFAVEGVEGGDLCTTVDDALTHTPPPGGGHVLVCDGTGRHGAFVCAERFAMAGLSVTLATLDGHPGQELGGRGDDIVWRRRMSELGVALLHDLRLQRVEAAGGRYRAILVHELTGAATAIDADRVVVEAGTRPVCDIYDDLRAASINDGEIDLEAFAAGRPQAWLPSEGRGPAALYRIGDASASRDIHAAIYEAFRLCRVL